MAEKTDQDAAKRFADQVDGFLPQMTREGITLFIEELNNRVANHLSERDRTETPAQPKTAAPKKTSRK